jgi:transcriptional regulator with XRE-family HTH domain
MTDPKFLTVLGARIKEIRQRKDLTQHELAMRCNFEKASMSRIESGKTNLTILTLRRISTALDTELSQFFQN